MGRFAYQSGSAGKIQETRPGPRPFVTVALFGESFGAATDAALASIVDSDLDIALLLPQKLEEV